MLLPGTYISALILLTGALVCFVAWVGFYKKVEAQWRFELFSIDFGLGALAFAVLAAFTFGTFGPEMSFSDRLLIAGQSAELWVCATGAIWAFGSLMLLVSSSLLGVATSFSITFGFAMILIAAIHFRFLQPVWGAIGLALLWAAVGGTLAASRPVRRNLRKSAFTKGIGFALTAALPFALTQWMLRHTADPEFGPGPYASTMLFGLGFLVATPIYAFFFMHIRIVGNPISFTHYKLGGKALHVPGLIAGAIWSFGFLLLQLSLSAHGDFALQPALYFGIVMLSITVCAFLSVFQWKEYRTSLARPRMLLIVCAVGIAIGSLCIGISYPS